MADDWQVGDLAVCVDARPNPRVKRVYPLAEGRVYRVAAVRSGPAPHSIYGSSPSGLILDGIECASSTGAFSSLRFRKVRPDEHEACEEEFSILLKLSKQRVSA